MSATSPTNSELEAKPTAAPEPAGRAIRWRRWLIGLLLLLAADAAQPPERQPSRFLALGAIDAYQATLSKLMPSMGVSCRFSPTCSHYAEGAIRARGTWVGIGLTAWRILRCGPWTPAGTVDPPPAPEPTAEDGAPPISP